MPCLADEVALKNGDHVTGSVVRLDAGKLTLQTEYAGAIQIDWDKVESVRAEQGLLLGPGDAGQVVVRDIRRAGGEVYVRSQGSETFHLPAEEITTFRSEEEQRAYEASLHPALFEGWGGILSVGFALARGNSATTNLSSGLNGARQSSTDKLSYYANSIYSTDRLLSTVTANAIRGGLRYDKNFNPMWFSFGSADFEYNQLQGLDLRSIAGGGLGRHVTKREHTTFDLLAGAAWTREEYSLSPQRDFVAGQFGEEFTSRLWRGMDLRHRGFYYPDLTDSSQYRATIDVVLSSKIKAWLSWQTAISERFVSNPPAGNRKNDLLVTTGLGITLGKH
ncbi:MAG TPA: DUF481 domain-containing protein [Terriglobales bacterium]|nr:DUF481 domain-containing protein [Terriglobales bacterium]